MIRRERLRRVPLSRPAEMLTYLTVASYLYPYPIPNLSALGPDDSLI